MGVLVLVCKKFVNYNLNFSKYMIKVLIIFCFAIFCFPFIL